MIINDDCLNALKQLPDNSIDSMITDPPYGINFMGKSWDDFSKGQDNFEKLQKEFEKKTGKRASGSNPDINIATAANCPIYKFEGMIEFFTPIWKEVYRVMKPNSYGFVMCIPRQDCLSRMILSLEQAGFAINFSPIYHAFATGFPKNLNIGKKVTKDIEKLMKEQGIEDIEWEN